MLAKPAGCLGKLILMDTESKMISSTDWKGGAEERQPRDANLKFNSVGRLIQNGEMKYTCIELILDRKICRGKL